MAGVMEMTALAGLCVIPAVALAQPANDHCANAQVITDGDWPYNLTGADTDGPTCSAVADLGAEDTQDVWFVYTAPADGVLNAVTCTNTFSSSVAIYTPDPSGCYGIELASGWIGAPDGPCPFSFAGDASTSVTAGQTVIIKVAVALFGSPAPSILHVQLHGAPTSCVTVPPGAIEEGEPCGGGWNDGCWSATEIASFPVDVAGTQSADNSNTDWDFYHIHVDSPAFLRATLNSDVPTALLTLTRGCDSEGGERIASAYMRDRCQTGEISAIVGAGDYFLKVWSDTSVGYPCGTINSYVLHVESSPMGASCLPSGNCALMTQADCQAAGGRYNGDGTACTTYAYESSSSSYEDIGATGAAGPDGEDVYSTVDLGFDFRYFGSTYSTVAINVNGFLQFGDNPSTSTKVFNTPLPNSSEGAPLNAICGLWDYLVTEGAPEGHNGQGRIVYQTLGSAPNRRFIAQWIGVGQINFFPLAPEGDPVNFEIVLFEGSNEIELRYGNITADFGQDYTIGVQDAYGVFATNIEPYTIGSGNVALRLAPTDACTSTCAADFNGDAFIDFFDYDDYVNCFETGTCPPGKTADFNGDDFVDFFDYDDFVGAFETGC